MTLQNKKVAFLVADGFEESEFLRPFDAVKEEGAEAHVISMNSGRVRSWKDGNWSEHYEVLRTIDDATAEEYDSLVIPGGVMSPDRLRSDKRAVDFVRRFFELKKPVAAICHGPWLLAEADAIKDRKLTSYPSIRTDLENAGANWVDEEVVVDQGLTTSRRPEDLKAFCDKVIEETKEGKHQEMAQSV